MVPEQWQSRRTNREFEVAPCILQLNESWIKTSKMRPRNKQLCQPNSEHNHCPKEVPSKHLEGSLAYMCVSILVLCGQANWHAPTSVWPAKPFDCLEPKTLLICTCVSLRALSSHRQGWQCAASDSTCLLLLAALTLALLVIKVAMIA